MSVKFSVSLQGSLAMNEYIRLAQKVEEYDFDAISIYDDLMFKPVWPIVTLIAEHTERIDVGPAIVNPTLVHPAYHAGNLAELDEVSEKRAFLGIGRGAFMEFLKVDEPDQPIRAVREAIELIEQLMRGDRTPFEGEVFQATREAFFRWDPPREEVPVIIGTWGPKMCQVAGENADGIKSDGLWNPDYVPILLENIEKGADNVDRDPEEIDVIAGPLCAVAEDREQAHETARRVLAVYLPYLSPMTEHAGIPEEEIQNVRAAAEEGDFEKGASYISDRSIRNCSVSGTPEDLIPQIEAMVEAGVDHVSFGHPLGPDIDRALELLGEEVLPHFN